MTAITVEDRLVFGSGETFADLALKGWDTDAGGGFPDADPHSGARQLVQGLPTAGILNRIEIEQRSAVRLPAGQDRERYRVSFHDLTDPMADGLQDVVARGESMRREVETAAAGECGESEIVVYQL